MLKAGLIGAGVGFVLAVGTSLLTPLCAPCVALLVGVGVGVLAAVWEKPTASGAGAGLGAQAGAIAGAGNLLGQMVGALINGFLVGPEGLSDLYRQFDMPVAQLTTQQYWLYNLGGNCLCGLVNVGLAAGLGALGGLLWYQMAGKNQSVAEEPSVETEL